jgi:hypothetical protein
MSKLVDERPARVRLTIGDSSGILQNEGWNSAGLCWNSSCRSLNRGYVLFSSESTWSECMLMLVRIPRLSPIELSMPELS